MRTDTSISRNNNILTWVLHTNTLRSIKHRVFGGAQGTLPSLPTNPLNLPQFYPRLLLSLVPVGLTARITSRAGWQRGPQGALSPFGLRIRGAKPVWGHLVRGGLFHKTAQLTHQPYNPSYYSFTSLHLLSATLI